MGARLEEEEEEEEEKKKIMTTSAAWLFFPSGENMTASRRKKYSVLQWKLCYRWMVAAYINQIYNLCALTRFRRGRSDIYRWIERKRRGTSHFLTQPRAVRTASPHVLLHACLNFYSLAYVLFVQTVKTPETSRHLFYNFTTEEGSSITFYI